MLALHVARIIGVLFDTSELKISRHNPFLFAWMDTSNGVNDGTDDNVNVGLIEDDGEYDGCNDSDGDEVGQVLPKRFEDSLEPKSPPSIITMP